MRIANFEDLATNGKKKDCLGILDAGLQAADPANILPWFVTPDGIKGAKLTRFSDYTAVHSVAFGKAADSMTRALNSILPLASGIIVIPKGSRSVVRGKKFRIINSRHPRPDQSSVKAAKEVAKFVENKKSGELIVFLVSGGASSLLALPDGITLNDKTYLTDLILKSGATIQEFNCVRKHVSKIKGGKLVQNMRCDGVGLVMSDVQGDDLSSIASGTTHADDTTYQDALDVLARYDLLSKAPEGVVELLKDNVGKDGPPQGPKIENIIIANNNSCLDAMKRQAQSMGYHSTTMQVFGDIKDAVKRIIQNIPGGQKQCLIFGGETTVKVLGDGAGGRNQELVLRLLKNTQDKCRLVIASMGTDGIDGNSVFAGAITENLAADPLVLKEYLRNNDSARFFQKKKSNIVTGFTHTNLMDIGIILNTDRA